ncbi:MAG: Yae1 family protein, partial [Nitrospirae bacterium]|nr:Yae1 family protein [Nitrospirota bacterium]
ELPDGSILHIEIQSASDGTMLKRMYLYSALIFCQYGRLPRQIVLYVGNKPHSMENQIGQYSYEIIDIRDINCSELLRSNKPEDAVLALLCNSDNMDVTISMILEKLSVLPEKTMNDYIVKLLNLADLRKMSEKVRKEVEKMPITIDARETWLYKEGLSDGELKGLSEGKLEGLFEGIELGLELKYGTAGLELMTRARAITTIDKLEEFKNLIKKAASVDELKGFLDNSVV